jgi:hypothetical protein
MCSMYPGFNLNQSYIAMHYHEIHLLGDNTEITSQDLHYLIQHTQLRISSAG